MNGITLARVVNYSPDDFRNVMFYASDPWSNPANVDVKNLVFENIPTGNDEIYLVFIDCCINKSS